MPWEERLQRASILIIDDQPSNVKLLEKLLRVGGYTNVVGVTSPQEGVDLYRVQGFDLVLLDIRMPGMSGFEVMARLKEIEGGSYIPVLVLTAQTDPETRFRALEVGAKDFLTKPFDRIEVLSRIRNLLEVRLLHNDVRDQNRLLEEKVRERTKELLDTRLEVIRRLARASEFRDNETGLHIIRMSKYAELIARHAGLSSERCDMILNASPMHDVGKLGIPDHILKKPSKLEPDEWEVMKSHTLIGGALLAGSDMALLQIAQQIALTHHEKWDGSGYPAGLRGEDIPLEGRITAIADVFDALTSVRPYKQAWTTEAAVEEIRSQAGRHFDAELVGVFLRTLPEVVIIQAEFAEPLLTAQEKALAGGN